MNDRHDRNDVADDGTQAAFVDNYLLYLLARASLQASRQFHALVKSEGVRVPEWRVLGAVMDRPENIGDLAKITLYQQPTLTKIVDRMCQDGLVERTRGQPDGRVVLVQATAKGLKIGGKLKQMALQHEDRILAAYNDRERSDLKGVLRQLILRTRDDGDTSR